MHLFSSKKIYTKVVSFFVTFLFLIESTLLPVITLLPRTASAAGWGVSIDSGKAGTFPNPVIRGKPVDFLATLTITDPPSPLNFKLEASRDLTLRHYYITRTGGQEAVLGDPSRPAATLANRTAYVWDFYNLTTGVYTLRFNFDVPMTTLESSAQFDIFMTGLHSGYGSGYQDQSFPVPNLTFPSGASVSQGTPLTVAIANATGNTPVYTNCISPTGSVCADNFNEGTTNASGQWSKSYDTSGWTLGTYRAWVSVGGRKSNLGFFTVTQSQPSTIQGYKIDSFGTVFTNPGATIMVSGAVNQTYGASANPYLAQQIPAGNYTVSSSVPSGYAVSYSLCANCIDHPASSYVPGNSVSVNAPSGGYADLWWKYTLQTTGQSVSISRTPATSQTNPYRTGSATTFNATVSSSLFSTDQQVKVYRKIGNGSPFVSDTSTTFTLRDNGTCNPSAGTCSVGGTWSEFICSVGVSGIQQMTEWVTIGSVTSNQIQWWFECTTAVSQPVTILQSWPTTPSAQPGQQFSLTYNWNGGPTSSSKQVFVHFVNSAGQIAFQDDHTPSVLTNQWSGIRSYTRTVTIPASAVAGSYRIMAGLYDLATGARLTLTPGSGVIADTQDLLRYQIGTLTVGSVATQLSITTTSLPQATVGAQYSASISALGGLGSYSWQITNGTLPPGLSTMTGVCVRAPCQMPLEIKGTPTSVGTYSFSAIVSDGTSSASKQFTIVVGSIEKIIPSISSLSPSSGPVGTNVTIIGSGFTSTGNTINFGSGVIYNLSSSNGTTLQFTVPSAILPPCAFSQPPCLLPAVITPSGQYAVSVTNANGLTSNTAQFNVTSTQTGTLSITTSSLPAGTIATPYSANINASGGTGSYSWQITNGTLPPGLSSNAAVCVTFPCQAPLAITGTPTTAGTYSFSAIVSDGTSSASKQFTITVSSAVSAMALSISPVSAALAVGQTQAFKAFYGPTNPLVGMPSVDVTLQTQWSSSNPAVAEMGAPPGSSVNNTVLGRIVGSAVITATYQGKTAQAQVTVTISSVATTPSTIQGYKIDSFGNVFTNPGATITVSGVVNQTYGAFANPYLAQQIPAGNYTVSSSVPSGYTVSYSLCTNCIDHPASSYVLGNSVSVNAPSGGYADLWWKYTLVAIQPSFSLSAGTAQGTTISFPQGTPLVTRVTSAAPNAEVRAFGTNPNGIVFADNLYIGTTDYSGSAISSFETGAWTVSDAAHPHTSYVKVNGVQSNTVQFNVTSQSGMLAITTTSLPSVAVGAQYSTNISASGGTGSYSWQITNGSLPSGLSSNAAVCVTFPCQAPLAITGTPTTAGTYSFFAVVSDGTSSASKQFTIVVSPAVSATALTISPVSVTLAVGQTQVFNAFYGPTNPLVGMPSVDVTLQAQWSSSNPAVAELGAPPGSSVNNTVLGRAAGSAVITAAYQGQTAQAQVKVGSETANLSLDLKVNNTDGPIDVQVNTPVAVSWATQGFSAGGMRCSTSGGPTGSPFHTASGVSGSVQVTFPQTQSYTLQMTCFDDLRVTADGSIPSAFDSVTVNVTATPPVSGIVPTPQTAPMATLVFQRDQEIVLPGQGFSFSGTIDANKLAEAGYAFPQGSSLVFSVPANTILNRIAIDGRTLASNEYSVNGETIHGQSFKIPFAGSLYSGTHQFQFFFGSTSLMDRLVPIWASVIDGGGNLLLKGRTASLFVKHPVDEVVGRGLVLALRRKCDPWAYPNPCSTNPFNFSQYYLDQSSEKNVTRTFSGSINLSLSAVSTSYALSSILPPYYVYAPTPLHIAYTLIPVETSWAGKVLPISQFSDNLSKEFITAYYQYILGRDPMDSEVNNYLPLFVQWRDPLANLLDVYNRRPDLKTAFGVVGTNSIDFNELVKWASEHGWQEESTLQSFKLQGGHDNARSSFETIYNQMSRIGGGGVYIDQNAVEFICGGDRLDYPPELFNSCWSDPVKRDKLIVWAKDSGWAMKSGPIYGYDQGGERVGPFEDPAVDGILKSFFTPGVYPEYQQERNWRYPPATLYYELVSSPEYFSMLQNRFHENIDSIFRLFGNRSATQSDFDWVKTEFTGRCQPGSTTCVSPVFINDQWEPVSWAVNPSAVNCPSSRDPSCRSYTADYFYGIRYVPGEVDTVSGGLISDIETNVAVHNSVPIDVLNGDNFKRIVTGLYRLYLRRDPSDSEMQAQQGKSLTDIEFDLNQSGEYGVQPASQHAIRSLYRNYLGRDPEPGAQAGATISQAVINISNSFEFTSLQQSHQENAYLLPIPRLTIIIKKPCTGFCSFMTVFSMVVGVLVPFPYGTVAGFVLGLGGDSRIGMGGIITNFFNDVHRTVRRRSTTVVDFSIEAVKNSWFPINVAMDHGLFGQAGGVYNPTNLLENADPTMLQLIRTMAQAPESQPKREFASGENQQLSGSSFASLYSALTALVSPQEAAKEGSRLAQLDVSSHYTPQAIPRTATTTQAVPSFRSASYFIRGLQIGSRGEDVVRLQQILSKDDWMFPSKYQTGYYGSLTAAAVKRLQKRNGLVQAGVVGPKTRALLNAFAQ